jgi:hypothetical protein
MTRQQIAALRRVRVLCYVSMALELITLFVMFGGFYLLWIATP